MSTSQGVAAPARTATAGERLFRELHPVGQTIAAARCAQHRRRPGFRMPAPARWRRELDFRGLRALGGTEQALRLFRWVWSSKRCDGRLSRRWVARVLLMQHRRYPGELTIAAGAQRIADEIAYLGGPSLTRQTVQRVLKRMITDGVLFRVQRGVSAAITGSRNHVSVYVVVAPDALDEAGQRALDELRGRLSEHLPVREVATGTEEGPPARSTGQNSLEQRKATPWAYASRNALERAEAVDWLIEDRGWRLDPSEVDELRRLLYPLLAGGFSARAVNAAMAIRPAGGPRYEGPLPGARQRDRWQPVRVRSLIRVLTWRLRPWLTEAPRWADRRPAYPPPIAVPTPRRGPQRAIPAPREPAILPATQMSASRRAQAIADIAAGNRRRQEGEAEFRAGKRLASRVAARQ